MNYCPICSEELQPGRVCSCGYDLSCDYEQFLSLIPAKANVQTLSAQRKAFLHKQIETQRKAYDEKFAELEDRQKAFEQHIQLLVEDQQDRQKAFEQHIQLLVETQQACRAEIQSLKKDNQELTAQQQKTEAKIEALSKRVIELETKPHGAAESTSINVAATENSTAQVETATNEESNVDPLTDDTPSFMKKLLFGSGRNNDRIKQHTTISGQLDQNPTGITSRHRDVKVGDVISFGQYWQGKNQSAGKTAIQWRVLAKEGSRALLISKNGLDAKPYNAEYEPITWADSSLEKWLNREFCREAFSVEEQKSMICRTVLADANPKYKTDPGKSATEKVFLLSIPEAEKYFASDDERKCVPTAFAVAQGAYVNNDYKTAEGEAHCRWWLRSPGIDHYDAAYVYCDGSVSYGGRSVLYGTDCVRPALWINLES